jgi:hypothetical protein
MHASGWSTNYRALGQAERVELAARDADGKRLTYRRLIGKVGANTAKP